MPLGDWLWPAIWLLPARSKYGQWPASGEIGMMSLKFFQYHFETNYYLVELVPSHTEKLYKTSH